MRARRALEEAEAKLKKLKHWNREFDSQVEPLARQLDRIHTVLSSDMLQATSHLAQVVQTLSAYSDVHPAAAAQAPESPAAPAIPGSPDATTEAKP